MGEENMDDFIRLKNNLRGGITQIVTRYAKIDLNKQSEIESGSEGIYYLDANNLYGGAMHRMMPYELVTIESDELDEIVTKEPNEWVMSLQTYDEYGYFIECDIDVSDELDDHFNDLPFFPSQRVGEYSSGTKKYAKENGVEIEEADL